jgi:hypothetical protein
MKIFIALERYRSPRHAALSECFDTEASRRSAALFACRMIDPPAGPSTRVRPVPRRRAQKLERVLGTPALFATAYGNVGSSIYYARPDRLLRARFDAGRLHHRRVDHRLYGRLLCGGNGSLPGGSSSFARDAFNEGVSFGAAWAQMLVYVTYGVKVEERLARGRQAGPTIVEEANRRGSEIIVIGAARKSERTRRAIFGSTVDYVLKHEHCRVMVVSASAPSA